MKYAIIENGVVVNIATAEAPLAENWIEAGSAQIGDSWDGETFTSPPKPLLYATAAEAKSAVVAWIDGLTAQVMDQYPRAVQARWSIEEAAARAVLADTATQDQTDLVTNEGAAKGRTPADHATTIVANADRFRAIADQINTLFLATDKALADATDPAQYEAILDAAIAQAAPLATAYGLDT